MSAIPSLFDLPLAPLPVRASDPETAKRSARDLPLRARQHEVVVALRHMVVASDAAAIKAWLLAELGLDRERNEVASRLSELSQMEPPLVKKGGCKTGPRGRPVALFSLTREGREAARE